MLSNMFMFESSHPCSKFSFTTLTLIGLSLNIRTCFYNVFMAFVCMLDLEVIKLEFILKFKIKRDDWLLADTCPQAANHCSLF